MNRIPPEIWEKIFGNLLDTRDCQSAYEANSFWSEILHQSRSSWRFGQTFASILQYLSNSDVFQCRRVCRHWSYSVDYFLENGSYPRPTSKHEYSYLSSRKLDRILMSKSLTYHSSNGPLQMERLLRNARFHPRCPIVGRAVCIMESDTVGCRPLNTEYLRVFGSHIYFLRTVIRDLTAPTSLQRILELLCHVPNLKKLDVECNIYQHVFFPGQLKSGLTPSQVIMEEIQTRIQADLSERLPKLETVKLEISGNYSSEVVETLLRLLSKETITSLSLNMLPSNVHLEHFGSLVDLNLELYSEPEFQELMQLKAPIRKLSLVMSGRVNSIM